MREFFIFLRRNTDQTIKMSKDSFSILVAGLESHAFQWLSQFVGPQTLIDQIHDAAGFERLVEEEAAGNYSLVICGPGINVQNVELAQGFRAVFPDVPIWYLTTREDAFERKDLIKNGFDDAFLYPLDKGVLEKKVQAVRSQKGGGVSYHKVRLIDLLPEEEIDFDLYLHLPANNKYLKYLSPGTAMGVDRYKKFQKKDFDSMFVETKELQKFYDYSARKLSYLNGDEHGMGETERMDRLKDSVRGVFATIFGTQKDNSVDKGKEMLNEAKGIIESFMNHSDNKDIYQQLKRIASSSNDPYDHSNNVAVYASLFSMASGIGKPDELSLAGLMHDIGEMNLPLDVLEKEEQDRSESENQIYTRHAEYSVEVIRERKLYMPDQMHKAIQQHHEKWNGKGYPKGIQGKVFREESQILALADRFDYLTRKKPGQPQLDPRAAFSRIREEEVVDPEILDKVEAIIQGGDLTTE